MRLATGEDVKKFEPLIYKLAIASWKKFPLKTRSYIEISDMAQDGRIVVAKALPKYDPSKADVVTYLWNRLDSFFAKAANALNRQKRYDGNVLWLEDLRQNSHFDVVDASIDEAEIIEHVKKAFLLVYFEASESLRDSLHRWFLKTGDYKVHTYGLRFREDKAEFRKLAARYKLNKSDCRFLMDSVECRNRVITNLPEFKLREVN